MVLVRVLTSAVVLGCVSATNMAPELRSEKTPGMLMSGPRGRPVGGKVLGFCFSNSPMKFSLRSPATCNRRTSATCNRGVRSLHLSHLVTYGDIWRNAVEEPNLDLAIENKFVQEHHGVSITGLSQEFELSTQHQGSSIQSVVRPVAKAATVVGAAAAGAAANIWTSLTKGPSEDEAQEALRRWARGRGGAVLPPLEEGELESEVRFVGMFPELVESMMDADLDAVEEQEQQRD